MPLDAQRPRPDGVVVARPARDRAARRAARQPLAARRAAALRGAGRHRLRRGRRTRAPTRPAAGRVDHAGRAPPPTCASTSWAGPTASRRGTTTGLAGGLYGVAVGGLFAGESMFHRRTDASKVALVGAGRAAARGRRRAAGCSTCSGPPTTCATLGAVEVPRAALPRAARRRPARLTARRPAGPTRPPDRAGLVRRRAAEGDHGGMTSPHLEQPDRPWMIRTYSGHSTAKASNELYRSNLAKGQTGPVDRLRPAHPDRLRPRPRARPGRGRQGRRAGRPPRPHGRAARRHPAGRDEHVDDDQRHRRVAARPLRGQRREPGGGVSKDLRGTTQNDIVKEYLSRGTYIFPPLPSRRLIVDMIAFCAEWVPLWNPMNVCSYHLQEAGATPTQELAYSLATAIGVLDAVQESGQVDEDRFPQVFASISFFVNSGIRFVEETAKMRAFTQLWDRIGLERYGVTDPKARRFRYGVQVNSLGLTEAQPENNVQRIVLEMLGVTLSRDARARSIQLPAWNEALGLPRPWDQQWALRMQQVLAYETDLLEYPDLFEGSVVVEGLTDRAGRVGVGRARGRARARRRVRGHRGAEGPARGQPRRAHAPASSPATSPSSGVNRFTEALPVAARGRGLDPQGRSGRRGRDGRRACERWRAERDDVAVKRVARGAAPRRRPRARTSCRPRSTSPTPAAPRASGRACCARCSASTGPPPASAAAAGVGGGSDGLRALAERVKALPGGPPRLLVAKPGLDGHSNGAEQIAVAAPRRRPRGHLPGHPAHPRADRVRGRSTRTSTSIGLSILSGSHLELVPEVVRLLPRAGRDRPGHRRRASSPRTTDPGCSPPTSPRSTRPRTSSSRRSWATSSTSSSPAAPADVARASPGRPRSRRWTSAGWVRLARVGAALDPDHAVAAREPGGEALGLVRRDGGVGGAVEHQRRGGDLAEPVLDRRRASSACRPGWLHLRLAAWRATSRCTPCPGPARRGSGPRRTRPSRRRARRPPSVEIPW